MNEEYVWSLPTQVCANETEKMYAKRNPKEMTGAQVFMNTKKNIQKNSKVASSRETEKITNGLLTRTPTLIYHRLFTTPPHQVSPLNLYLSNVSFFRH
jgi:hypothetical protein